MSFQKKRKLGISEDEIRYIFKVMSKEEREAYIEQYDKEVDDYNSKINKMIAMMETVPKTFITAPEEIQLLHNLSRTNLNDHTAVFVPKFKEAINLQQLTGCHTAFMSETPVRIVLFKELLDGMNDIGLLFVLMHESQHFIRRHHSRQLNRNSKDWNIATDLIINYNLSNVRLPRLLNAIDELVQTRGNRTSDKFKFIHNTDMFEDQEIMEEMNYIGNENPPLKLKGTPADTSDWFRKYIETNKWKEEEIYDAVVQDLREMRKKQQQQSQSQGSPQGSPNQDGDQQGQSMQDPNGIHSQGQGGQQRQNQDPFGDDERHMQDGKEMHDKGTSNEISDKYDDLFGEHANEMRESMRKTLRDYGAPSNSKEKSLQKQHAKKMMAEMKREVEKKTQQAGMGTSDIDEYMKREKDIEEKMSFNFRLQSMIVKKSESGEYYRTNERTRFSRMTGVETVQVMMDYPNRMNFYKKEQRDDTFVGLIIMDTSGSVSIEEITRQYLNEIKGLIFNNNIEFHVVSADTQVKDSSRFILNKDNFEHYEKNGFPISGGGGTDMLLPLAHELVYGKGVEQNGYDVAIILSDGGFEAFSRDELMKEMNKEYNAYSKLPSSESTRNNIKRLNKNRKGTGSTASFNNPPIIILNTREMYYKASPFDSFKRNELQEFVLNNKEQQVNVHQTEQKRNNGFNKPFGQRGFGQSSFGR